MGLYANYPIALAPGMGLNAAAFACTNRICSQPVFDPAELGGTVTQMLAATGSKGYSLFQ